MKLVRWHCSAMVLVPALVMLICYLFLVDKVVTVSTAADRMMCAEQGRAQARQLATAAAETHSAEHAPPTPGTLGLRR